MSDPLLEACCQAPGLYRLGGTAIDVCDQLLRGVMMARRLADAGHIGPGHPLVVTGAGVGGVATAIEAARLGVTVHLVEVQSAAFMTQQLGRSRYIDPVQHDWPLDHCHARRLPWSTDHPALPLAFDADYADHLSLRWRLELLTAQHDPTIALVVLYDTCVAAASPSSTSSDFLEVMFASRKSPPKIVLAGAVVEAIGVASENCEIRDAAGDLVYEGQPFWGPDDFTRLTSANRVLIGGSGDGALQDYLRVLTHRDRPLDILNACNVPSSLLHALQSAEERAHRGRSWASDRPPSTRAHQEGPYLEELDRLHRSVVGQALGLPLVKAGLDTLVGSKPPDVCLVHGTSHLTCRHGLDRFLVLLLDAYFTMWRSKRTLYPGVQIEHVAPHPTSTHLCVAQGGPDAHPRAAGTYVGDTMTSHACFLKKHDVTFRTTANPCPVPPPGPFDVIVVRYGTETPFSTGPDETAVSRPGHLPLCHLLA